MLLPLVVLLMVGVVVTFSSSDPNIAWSTDLTVLASRGLLSTGSSTDTSTSSGLGVGVVAERSLEGLTAGGVHVTAKQESDKALCEAKQNMGSA